MSDPLIVYPKTPRPSFADQVLAIFRDRMLLQVLEERELQIAIGLVGARQGISIVPDSLQGMIRPTSATGPSMIARPSRPSSSRAMDRSKELVNILAVIYALYEERGIRYAAEEL